MQGVYAITDELLMPENNLLQTKVQAALEGGIRLLQYRNKLASPAVKLQQAQMLKSLCSTYQVPLLINDDLSLCQEVAAAGVHLGQNDGDVNQARRQLGPDAIIGVTCHDSIASALQAQEAGASYVAFGRFFASRTKPNALPARPEILHLAQQKLRIPIVAIGGINAENGASLLAAGADMLAVIHYLFSSPDVMARTKELNMLFASRQTQDSNSSIPAED